MKKKHIILVAVVAFLLLVYGINVHNAQRRQLPAQTPETVTVTPQLTPVPGEFTNYYTKQRAELGLNLLRDGLPSFNPEMRYDNVNGWLFYDLTSWEISPEFIQNAKDGVGHCAEDWAFIVDKAEHIQSSLQRIFTEQDDDTIVVLDILNPANTDEVWLSVANGIAGYDVVNGIDLLNGQS